jgi:hypothetical protein
MAAIAYGIFYKNTKANEKISMNKQEGYRNTHLEEFLNSLCLLELNICSCSNGQQVLKAIDYTVRSRSQGWVTDRQAHCR